LKANVDAARDMPDSLFGSDDEQETATPATLDALPILGLYLLRNVMPPELQSKLVQTIASKQYFNHESDQVMLWGGDGRSLTAEIWPELPGLLEGHLPIADLDAIMDMQKSLQVIVNLYELGKGITPHVDLVSRYGPLVLGISLLSSTAMEFEKDATTYSTLLEAGDIYVLTGEARYDWKHSIPARSYDLVCFNSAPSLLAYIGVGPASGWDDLQATTDNSA
jgi:hypothetical protein